MTLQCAKNNIVDIYTDGACSGNPGPGGWGAYFKYASGEEALCGGAAQTTNNRMELLAVIQALTTLKPGYSANIYTDSQYVQLGIGTWIINWKKKGWRTAAGAPVKNMDLWKELDALVALHTQKGQTIQWHWVKGHAGDPGNERADTLARQGILKASKA